MADHMRTSLVADALDMALIGVMNQPVPDHLAEPQSHFEGR